MFQWSRLHTTNSGGPGLIPGRGTRSQMPQLKTCVLRQRSTISRAANKTRHSQLNSEVIPWHVKKTWAKRSRQYTENKILWTHLITSVSQFSRSVVSDTLRPHGLQHARPPCPSPTPGVYSNSCPLRQWCHPTISSSVVPFSSWIQSFPASVFSNESALRIRWPKHWSSSFTGSITASNHFSPGFFQSWFCTKINKN